MAAVATLLLPSKVCEAPVVTVGHPAADDSSVMRTHHSVFARSADPLCWSGCVSLVSACMVMAARCSSTRRSVSAEPADGRLCVQMQLGGTHALVGCTTGSTGVVRMPLEFHVLLGDGTRQLQDAAVLAIPPALATGRVS